MFGRQKYVPMLGERVLLLDRLGTFQIEQTDAEKRVAVVRLLRPNADIETVSWDAIFPEEDAVRILDKWVETRPED